jgi:hypothetical protein
VESINFVFLHYGTMIRNEFEGKGHVNRAGKCSPMFGRVSWGFLM